MNQALVEELYQRFRDNPRSVDESWQRFFEAYDGGAEPSITDAVQHTKPNGRARANGAAAMGNGRANGAAHAGPLAMKSTVPPPVETEGSKLSPAPPTPGDVPAELQDRVSAMVNAYRVRGHLFAHLDPLGLSPRIPEELSLEAFGLDHISPDTVFATGGFFGPPKLPLREIVRRLKEAYCRTIGAEFTYIEEPEMRVWLQERMERTCNRLDLTHEQQVRILSNLIDAEIFEQFLHTKYVGAKRFSLEGAESMIPLLELLIEHAARDSIGEIVIGMAHRGRLNVLANVMKKSLREIFAAFEDENPELHIGRGDVKYHLGYSSDRVTDTGHNVHLTLSFNPSHLEWVNPVVEGRVRAKQDRYQDTDRKHVLPLLVHGDASFVGQGVVAETLNLSQLRGYATGGTVHVVLNNQIGFTTATQDSRSTRYCTDIVRMLRCPVFHVNGEDPEAVAQVVNLAMDFRQRYKRDVVIDMYCYRRYGHNEADEPRFTQPVMYGAIDKKPSVRNVYVKKLVESGRFTEDKAEEIERSRRELLEKELQAARENNVVPQNNAMQGVWENYVGGKDAHCPDADTRIPKDRIKDLLERLITVPEDFHVQRKLKRLFDIRRNQASEEKPLDWGAAETLAYATLVEEGASVRFSGQDSRRGTFSHRHAVLFEAEDGRTYTPLAHLSPNQARFEIWDSPLSEAGVVGFEYGYSLDYPDGLVIWEAQFGDFCNGAQVIIDQFLCSSEDKWYRLSGLVMLLPHGFEGQGPEHSSARLERFLALCAEDNMQVCNLTTPAQFFHVLRRQVLRPYRKPLIIMSPKSLLRSPAATSSLDDLAEGGFQRIIPDQSGNDPSKVERILLCAGKIYYELDEERRKRERDDVAIIRVEQLYPLGAQQVREALAPYAEGTPVVWVQEEPWNMGAWYYMRARLPEMLEGRFPLKRVSRPESASPATGSMAAHKLEQARLIEQAFAE